MMGHWKAAQCQKIFPNHVLQLGNEPEIHRVAFSDTISKIILPQ